MRRYCECFAASQHCGPLCKCACCYNTPVRHSGPGPSLPPVVLCPRDAALCTRAILAPCGAPAHFTQPKRMHTLARARAKADCTFAWRSNVPSRVRGTRAHSAWRFQEYDSVRKEAVDLILERNPNAFRPKIETHDSKHIKGCHCKKSGCNKKCAGRSMHCERPIAYGLAWRGVWLYAVPC